MSGVVRVAVVGGVAGAVTPSGLWARLGGAAELVDAVSGVDALPVLVRRRGVSATVDELAGLGARFGALVLVGFDARCVAIERGVAEAAPGLVVVHERHGVAVVALACVREGLRLRGGAGAGERVVVRGGGAAAVGVVGLLRHVGFEDLVVVRRGRVLVADDVDPRVPHQMWLASSTNPGRVRGGLSEAATDAVALVDVEGGAWDVAAATGRMARSPVLVSLAPDDRFRSSQFAPAGAIVARCMPSDPGAIVGLDVLAGLAKGIATTGAAAVGNDVLATAATGLESSLARSGVPRVGWEPFDPEVAGAVAGMVAASTGPGPSAAGLTPLP